GRLDEAAGVDDHDVGTVGVRGERIAVLGQPSQHTFGIDEVLGTAETDERKTALGLGAHAAARPLRCRASWLMGRAVERERRAVGRSRPSTSHPRIRVCIRYSRCGARASSWGGWGAKSRAGPTSRTLPTSKSEPARTAPWSPGPSCNFPQACWRIVFASLRCAGLRIYCEKTASRASAPAADGRQEVDLAPRRHRLQQSERGDLGAHGDGDSGTQLVAVAQSVPDAGVQPLQLVDDLAHGGAGNLDGLAAAGQVAQRGGYPDDGQRSLLLFPAEDHTEAEWETTTVAKSWR